MTTYSPTKGDGARWASDARNSGLRASAHGDGVIALSVTFAPGDAQAYALAESKILGHLADAPATASGSTWGGTSDGIGGAIALDRGSLTIKRSGISKRFANGLR